MVPQSDRRDRGHISMETGGQVESAQGARGKYD
jgi:hypothetical protein